MLGTKKVLEYEVTKMTAVTLPTYLYDIADYVITEYNYSIKYVGSSNTVRLPYNQINGYTFTKLTEWGHTNKPYTSVFLEDGILQILDGCFGYCYSLVDVKLSNTLTSIGQYAFKGCPITNIIIPPSVQTIDLAAFSDTNLTSVIISPTCVYHPTAFPDGCTINFYD